MTPAEATLAEQLARSPVALDADRIRALAVEADYARLLADLRSRRMLPLLGGRLTELTETPPDFAAAVAEARRGARVNAMARAAQTEEVLRQLHAAGIRAVALKGAGLAEAAHGDVGMRSPGDVDVLVDRDRLRDAVALLSPDGRHVEEGPLPLLHHILRRRDHAPVELHWRLHFYEDAFAAEYLEQPDVGAGLLLFYARDGFHGLRLAADIGGWYARHAVGARGLLDDAASRHPALGPAWRTAARVAERVAGVPATTWFSEPGEPTRREARAAALAAPAGIGDRDQLAADVLAVNLLLAPPSALRTVVRAELDNAPGGRRAPHVAKRTLRAAYATMLRT